MILHVYTHNYVLVVIEGFFNSVGKIDFNSAVHKNWYNLHSV